MWKKKKEMTSWVWKKRLMIKNKEVSRKTSIIVFTALCLIMRLYATLLLILKGKFHFCFCKFDEERLLFYFLKTKKIEEGHLTVATDRNQTSQKKIYVEAKGKTEKAKKEMRKTAKILTHLIFVSQKNSITRHRDNRLTGFKHGSLWLRV